MIFTPDLAALVLSGHKIQTRRRMSDNERSPWFRHRCGYHVGQRVAVCPGRGKTATGHVVIVAVGAQRLEDVTTGDAIAEGFPSREAFLSEFARINGTRGGLGTVLNEEVWALTFRVADGRTPSTATPDPPIIRIDGMRKLHAIRGFGFAQCGVRYGHRQQGQFRYLHEIRGKERERVCRGCCPYA